MGEKGRGKVEGRGEGEAAVKEKREEGEDRISAEAQYMCTCTPPLAPPSFPSLAVRKCGRGPGIIHHMSDVEGREKGREDLIEHRQIVDVPMHVVDR